MKLKKYIACAALAFVVVAKPIPAETPQTGIPVNVVGDNMLVSEWLALGPFPNPEPENPGERRGGFEHDFLAPLGGEANARVAADTTLSGAFGGVAWSASAKPYTLDRVRDLSMIFTPGADTLAYVFADLQSAGERTAVCRFLWNSADYMKVWLNGELLHPTPASAAATAGGFPVTLKAGLNRLTVKVEPRYRHGLRWFWNPCLQFLGEERAAENERVGRFLHNDTLRVKTNGGRRFVKAGSGKLPAVEFENPELAAQLLDMGTLAVRWFDAELNEVTEAAKPGFYCGYVSAKSPAGLAWRRVVPLMVFDDPEKWSWRAWDFNNKNLTAWQEDGAFRQAAWEARRPLATDTLQDAWRKAASGDDVPLWMGEMALDLAPAAAWREAPYSHMQDYLARLRNKVLDRPAPRPLAPPTAEPTATALRTGTEAEAGFKPGTVEKIRAALAEWCEATGEGFVAVVARRGVVVFHEAFTGAKDTEQTGVPGDDCPPDQLTDGKMTVSSRLETASTTKLFAGVILGRCIDQGLVALDDPVGKYFPDFPASGPLAALTVRRLMNHTNGLSDYRSPWTPLGGMVNPFMDIPALWYLEGDATGMPFYSYGSLGIHLGGKVVEDVTGRSVFRVMRDGLFEPLGMDGATIQALAWGLSCTAMDLARMAEMLRLGGAYDGKRYLRPETLESLLPTPVGTRAPDVNPSSAEEEYGVGIAWLREPLHLAWEEGGPYIFGPNVFGHGSATGAILRVARDHELVVAMVRYSAGPNYEAHKNKFLQAIADGLPDNDQ